MNALSDGTRALSDGTRAPAFEHGGQRRTQPDAPRANVPCVWEGLASPSLRYRFASAPLGAAGAGWKNAGQDAGHDSEDGGRVDAMIFLKNRTQELCEAISPYRRGIHNACSIRALLSRVWQNSASEPCACRPPGEKMLSMSCRCVVMIVTSWKFSYPRRWAIHAQASSYSTAAQPE